MHSIKSIRDNPEFFKKKFEARNAKVNLTDLLGLDKKTEK